jgi:hypothetical protein
LGRGRGEVAIILGKPKEPKSKATENYERFIGLWKEQEPRFWRLVEDSRKRLAGMKQKIFLRSPSLKSSESASVDLAKGSKGQSQYYRKNADSQAPPRRLSVAKI